MKHLTLFLIFFFSIGLHAQSSNYEKQLTNLEYEGIKLFKFEKQRGFSYNMELEAYVKKDVGYFDYVAIKPEGIIVFICMHPSAMKYLDIYNDIVKLLGKREDKDDSYIPNYAEGDIEYIATLIDLGKAKLIKIWTVSTYNVILTYEEKGLSLGTIDRTK